MGTGLPIAAGPVVVREIGRRTRPVSTAVTTPTAPTMDAGPVAKSLPPSAEMTNAAKTATEVRKSQISIGKAKAASDVRPSKAMAATTHSGRNRTRFSA